MIESISIADIATYGNTPEILNGLSKFNFVFGSNGTGKTTVSRLIADEKKYPTCNVTWKGGAKLQPLVYNQDFVEKNFNQSTDLKGVFTLGEQHADTLEKITTAKEESKKIETKIENLTKGLNGENDETGKLGELEALETKLKTKCWMQKQKHDANLKGAFKGVRGNAENFKARVLQESDSNSEKLLTLEELEKRAETIFGPPPTAEQTVPSIEATQLIAYESSTILEKCVIGKNDVDIAHMISKLGNSDWVREGRVFFDKTEKRCPFCQQSTTDMFAISLNEYFDETFETDSKAIDDLISMYSSEALRLQTQINLIIATPSKFLDNDKLKAQKELFDSKVTINTQRLFGKKKEASRVVKLDSLSDIVAAIKLLIDSANDLIIKHNQTVKNLSIESDILTNQVWKYVLEELKTDLSDYKKQCRNLKAAITGMTSQVASERTALIKKTEEIKALEKHTTSIQPTIDGINELLSSFGFQGFSLAKAANSKSYKLIRVDGSDAKLTLSEGEKTFVTFLYFYYRMKGSDSDSGITTDRIVVFDDPVSSLDSDILFIVGSLIKGLFDEVREGTGYIKQVFVLTHNVYFHKEITFNPKRSNGAMNEETFWVIRKPGLISKLDRHLSNPIKTSYELMWSEVKKTNHSNLTIQNTLRRIIENYFKFFGGIDPKDLCNNFSGKEKFICNSLISWINDGSHYAQDDLYVSIEDTAIESYLTVFKSIFEKTGQIAHYKMMMGEAFDEEASV